MVRKGSPYPSELSEKSFRARPFTVLIEKRDPKSGQNSRVCSAQVACGFINQGMLLILTTFHLLHQHDLLALVFREMMIQKHDPPDELKPPTHIVADHILNPDDLSDSIFIVPAEITGEAKQSRMRQSVEWYLKMLNHLLKTSQISCTIGQVVAGRAREGKKASFGFALPYNHLTGDENKHQYGWPFDALLVQIKKSPTDTDPSWNTLLHDLSHENCGESTYPVEEMETLSSELVNDYDRRADTITWWLKGNQVDIQPIEKLTAANAGYTPNTLYTGTKDDPGKVMQISAVHQTCLTRDGDSGSALLVKNEGENCFRIAAMLISIDSDPVYPIVSYFQSVPLIIDCFRKLYDELKHLTLLGQDLHNVDTETLYAEEAGVTRLSESHAESEPEDNVKGESEDTVETPSEESKEIEAEPMPEKNEVILPEEAGVTRLSESHAESEPEEYNVKGESEDTVESRNLLQWVEENKSLLQWVEKNKSLLQWMQQELL